MSQAFTHPSECPNCGTPLACNYCPNCGQKVTPISPTLSYFLHDLTHELFHVDGKIFQSVLLLLTRPGFLTREYFLGRRARYISPIRLYLIFSLAFFVTTTLPGREPVFAPNDVVEIGPVGRLIGLDAMSPQEANELVDRAQHDWVPRAMFVLVPLGALLVQVVTRRSGKTYPQHLYFALHVHAAYFAVLAVTTLLALANVEMLSTPLSLLRTVFLLGYVLVAFRTAYNGSWPATIGRAVFVLFMYTNAVTIALVLGVAVLAR